MNRNRILAVLTVAAVAAVLPATTAGAHGSASPQPAAAPLVEGPAGPAGRADVTGDGIPDVVVATGARKASNPGSTGETGGSIYVIPGGAASVPGAPVSMIDQDDPSVVDDPEPTDDWGSQLVMGDFNGDRRADVAIGNPHESVDGKANAGEVTILYGKPTSPYLGLIPSGTASVTQDSGNVAGVTEAGDYFGAALAAGDFNADGFADLAVGSPGEAIGKVGAAGSITVFYGGGTNGLRTDNPKDFTQNTSGIGGTPEKNDHFGSSLAAGDVTGDGRDDLAVDIEGEDVSGTTGAQGCVILLTGSASGVTAPGKPSVCVPQVGITGHIDSVVIGRFHGGANADVVAYADQVRGGPAGAGALVVMRGGSSGISSSNLTIVTQDTTNVSGGSEAGDSFGAALAVGDVNNDGADDLAVGVPGEDAGGGAGQGGVQIFAGSASGLTSVPDLSFNEDDPVVEAGGQAGEGFGSAVRFTDTNNDGTPELVVTAPMEGGSVTTGAMFVIGLHPVAGGAPTLASSTMLTRTGALGGVSAYGAGYPIAGGVIPPDDLPTA